MRIALSARAKQRLRKRPALKVSVRVSYRSRDGQTASRTVSITFKQPNAKSNAAGKGGR